MITVSCGLTQGLKSGFQEYLFVSFSDMSDINIKIFKNVDMSAMYLDFMMVIGMGTISIKVELLY